MESSKAFFAIQALGFATIPVRDEKWSQKVTISTPEEVKANQTLKVSLDVNAGYSSLKDAVAMISVVDEGLLSLTNHPSPNPTKSLFPKMPLNVQTFETIGWSVPTPSTGDNVSAGGGADGARRAKVVNLLLFGQESSIFHKMERSMLILIFHNTVAKFALWL